MKPVIVIGLGNSLLRDEGIGLMVVRRLAEQKDQFPDVEFIEAGTSLFGAMHRLRDRRRAIFVDCAFMGQPPGTILRLTPDSVRSVKSMAGFSLHEGDLLEVLELSRRLGECPKEVVLFGIEPVEVTMGEGLSSLLEARLPEYVRAVARELQTPDADTR